MVFSSAIFLFAFLPALIAVYYVSPKRIRNVVLLIASLIFYSWGEPKNVFIMLASIIVNYVLGFLVGKEWKLKKLFLVISVVFNLGLLFVFKYLNFTVDTVNSIFGSNIEISRIALPIGISFFTFQIMSYVIDVYRGSVKTQKNVISLALYISLFPQLIAGPIVRYIDVEKQINGRVVDSNKLYDGALRFMLGFSKKVLIADRISWAADLAFNGGTPSIYTNWIGMIAYTLQIYFDFSGYSDMAIGLGKIFGFDFLENFDYPYISKSVQEFWRRWHISLGSWFRDYLYIPLGGNRKGKARTYINLLIVFFMTGLWHGASFNFIVWGLFYAVFLIIERLGFKNVLERIPAIVSHIYTIIVFTIGWVFFRAPTLTYAIDFIKHLFVPYGNGLDRYHFILSMDYQLYFLIVVGIILAIPHKRVKAFFKKNKYLELLRDFITLGFFFIAISYMVGSGFSPFLYFRF